MEKRPEWVLRLIEQWKDRHPAFQALGQLSLETMGDAERMAAYYDACLQEHASLVRAASS